jgi:predicted amidohydrolase
MLLRVAAAQFRTGKDTQRVLGGMLALIDAAAAGDAQLVHFQETCNYPTSYDSREHAWREAITIPGAMLDAISARAKANNIHVSFNASVRGPSPNAWMVNHLIGPDGVRIGGNAKQILMWIERQAFVPADEEGQVFDTALGRIGLLSCMDGLIPETARVLACKGADIILNSLCSNGLDEAHTHVPARAAENGVFMLSANRIGDMVDGADLERLIRETGMSREKVSGAGESQVVGPDGEVLARAGRDNFGLVFADIDLAQVQRRQRLAGRRPECYGLLREPNESLAALWQNRPAAGRVALSTLAPAPATSIGDCLTQVREQMRTLPAGLTVLPEYFAWSAEQLRAAGGAPAGEIAAVTQALTDLARERSSFIVAGIPDAAATPANRAVLFGPDGVLGDYRQVHGDPLLGWRPQGREFPTFDLPFGRIGLLLGEDLFYPEAARVLARQGVDLIACPLSWRTEWQDRLMLTERSAENRIAIVAAARSNSAYAARSVIVSTPAEPPFARTGEVSFPDRWVAPSHTGVLTVTVDLNSNRDKRLMASTNVILDTQPRLYGALVAAQPGDHSHA